MASKLRVLSGIQPTSASYHVGNYLGALKQWVAMQDDYEVFYFLADLHALTAELPDPAVLTERSRRAAAQLIAAGVEPERSAIFLQSHVEGHTQLSWVLECLTGDGEARRMTQFKDRSARGERVSVGLLTYPVLMAADILIYQAHYVPVGADQRQHVELTRTLAQRFNARYGDTLVVPDAYVTEQAAKILDLQDPTAKMSKSRPDAGTINLLDEPTVLTKKIKRAVTDTGTEIRYDPATKPGVSNLLSILSAVTGTTIETLESELSGKGYGTLKGMVADAVVAFAEPFAKRVAEVLADPAEIDRVLARGAERARPVAQSTVADVYARVGFVPPPARL
ncbi:MAG: tryptophan--tRNA ligase [Jatrophihabitans sp.]